MYFIYFLQHTETTQLKQILDTSNIAFYTRYVDDILIIYDTEKVSPGAIKDHINSIHPALKFTPTYEQNNRINFLDLTIIRHPSKIEVDIYRKPTTTDTTISYTSNHPTEHKMAAYRYMVNRMLTLPLTTERRNNEWQTILRMANNNQYPLHLITRLKARMQIKQQKPKTTEIEGKAEKGKKWATFTHYTPKIRTITNLFRDTDIKIAYKTTNTIQQRTKTRQPDTTNDLYKSGVYKMTCKTCNMAYIGQTSRNLTTRCREHIRYIQTNKPQSAYAQHILNNIHEYGTPTETITLLKHITDQTMLVPYEQLFIQAFTKLATLSRNSNATKQTRYSDWP